MDGLTHRSTQSSRQNNPFFDAGSISGLSGNVETRRPLPAPRVLFCFIDVKGTAQLAHYALVPLPPTYEDAINVAFEAFQSQLAESKLFNQAKVEFNLMIKSIIRLGDPSGAGAASSSAIWADIHPRNQWSSLVRDGDEILICAKLPPTRQHSPPGNISPHDPRIKPVSEMYAGPKIVFCHKPYGALAYMFATFALQYIQTFEDAKAVAHGIYHNHRKPFQGDSGWSVDHVKLFYNTMPRLKSGNSAPMVQPQIDNTTWPAIRMQGMGDGSKLTEVEVVYEFR